ncbi:hypothetical protein Q765_13800 [Flavobacterium rivuli WB 3.3-2 = DSM 21788]|uniref:Zinc chelation protein SecC n=1 Tax=Flavobacterium rivuli WB 3.3-2 = DSM 21788 TaxID=1121895 RepID=A0A0A2LZU3_9FLAO|nr:SEC-C domain-containing protein [Flavobacterium rivuli]KGO85902.1 hypothetical protein Q765_13800 [Flavobacterium rivuli WB 3.3-2 = DSM 21788]
MENPVQNIISELNASHHPIELEVKPELNSKPNDCLNIVKRKVERDGGKMVLGWQIWKNKYWVEAEFHAVWEDLNLELHDISPKIIPIDKILFVEDENLIYDGTQKESIRLNYSNNEFVNVLFKIYEAIFRFDNKGERKFLYDLSLVLNDNQLGHKMYLITLKQIVEYILKLNGDRNSNCPCKSGKKFDNCHGKDLDSKVSQDI